MDCEQVKELSISHILGELESKSWESLALEFHLQSCQHCAAEHENNRRTIKFIEDHKFEFAEAFESLEKRAGCRRLIWRISAAAACLAIGVLACLLASDSRLNEWLNPNRQVSAPLRSVRIEMLADSGGIIIPAGELIESGNSIKTLVINGRHRLIMSTDTTLTVRPLTAEGRTGCIVNLDFGRIYTNVQHDGNPFVVKTDHGRAIITGTSFDITAENTGTRLVVVEGLVQFVSDTNSVEVGAGRLSEIIAGSAPSEPQFCDAAELTAWAATPRPAPAQTEIVPIYVGASGDYNLADLGFYTDSGPIDLATIDYDNWIGQKREWFSREFPHIFQLQAALREESIEIDYPRLLVLSGDIQRFVYPPASQQQLIIPDLDSLLKAAANYGFDEKWLTANVKNPGTGSKDGMFTDLKAIESWAGLFEQTEKSRSEARAGLLLDSLHAAAYLENTRALYWLCIVNGISDVPDKQSPASYGTGEKLEILNLLQTQVNAADELKGRIISLLMTSSDQSCDYDDYKKLLEAALENINQIKQIEERILDYEAGG